MVILLAEDDINVQYFIWKLLKSKGFTVITASNGEAALKASRAPGRIDLLLTDIEMPRMNGLELCRRVSAERPDIKVLLMSGESSGRRLAEAGSVPFLQKPFAPSVLLAAIEQALGSVAPKPEDRKM